MKDIYAKLNIPEPSADLEDRIIAAANASTRKRFLPQLIATAACFLIIFAVFLNQTEENQEIQVSKSGILDDIEFFDDQYGFYEEIS